MHVSVKDAEVVFIENNYMDKEIWEKQARMKEDLHWTWDATSKS